MQNLPQLSTFQSTPFVRRETRFEPRNGHSFSISIHSLREKGDENLQCLSVRQHISIHSLREKGDPPISLCPRVLLYFNPLPS